MGCPWLVVAQFKVPVHGDASLLYSIRAAARNKNTMLQNYLSIAIRHLRRNARYLLINVVGLGLALGFCVLAYLNYQFANTFDHWHRDAARIVRVEMVKASNGEPFGACPGALGEAARNDLSGVEAMTRYDQCGTVVKSGDRVFNEGLFFADENFFQFFDFQLKSGVADLADRNAVVIDEEMAEKYFGTQDPIGQSLLFYADTEHPHPLTVTGVLKNIPLNSSLRFHFIAHLDNQIEGVERVASNTWKRALTAVFLKLKRPDDFATVQSGLAAYVAPRNLARPDWTVTGYRLEWLRDLATTSRDLRGNWLWHGLPPSAVWGNLTMAVLLLLTAALNFANMTIAACNRRLREMGVRKVMGGTRFQLMRQLLGESLIVVTLAAGLGMVMAYPIADWFNATWKFTDLRVDYSDTRLVAYVLGIVLFTTFLAGGYPAFYLSAFRPASIFRGGVLFGGSNLFSRAMMGLQVAISLVAVVVGLSFARNAEFNRTADIGFDYQPILQAWLPNEGDFQKFEDAVRDLPGVVATAGSLHLPGFGFSNVEFKWQGEGQESAIYQVGNNFPTVAGLRLAAGEWPVPAGDTTVSPEIVVNETFAREIGGNQAIVGESVVFNNRSHRIAGVVSDFMTNTPFSAIRPAILHPVPKRDYRRCLIKTANVAQQPQVMASIEQKWKALFPYAPFNVGYQNEMLREAIEVSDNIARSMVMFALVAILMTITGLFSLVSLNALRRMREVAIRRVMGASWGHIAWILNKNYGWIFGIAIVVGCFSGRFFALALMNSIFKINIGVQMGTLAWSALGILAIAAATIGLKLWQTLRVNPADVLRGD
jgi:ABC-type antimicrobial peptide transport system permease subunit